MAKKADMEKYFYDEYNTICEKLYKNYMVELKKKIINDGHGHLLLVKCNGTIENILCGYIKNMFIEYCEDIVKIVETIKQEFELSLSDKFIEEFNEKNIVTIDGHIISIEKKMEEIIGCKLSETSKSNLINISLNAKNDILDKIKKKNESIKRLLKLEQNKHGFLNKVKTATVESFIGWLIPFLLGILVCKFDDIIKFLRNIIDKLI